MVSWIWLSTSGAVTRGAAPVILGAVTVWADAVPTGTVGADAARRISKASRDGVFRILLIWEAETCYAMLQEVAAPAAVRAAAIRARMNASTKAAVIRRTIVGAGALSMKNDR